MRRLERLPRPEWRELRRQVWARDDGCCCHCGEAVRLRAAHCDHIQPISQGGTNELVNLRTLCRSCHTLRAGPAHAGLRVEAARRGHLPRNWKHLLWDDEPEAGAGSVAEARATERQAA